MKPPEGAIVDAIWRCKRGHESAAAWSGMNVMGFDGVKAATVSSFLITLEDGSHHDICIRCLVEDYGTERVDFKEG